MIKELTQQVAFDKGVKHGTTIRNINWNSENHQRHGKKMAKAKEEAKKQERERILKPLYDIAFDRLTSMGVKGILLENALQALKEEK